MAKELVGMSKEWFTLWDKFALVGNSYEGRTIWAIGQRGDDVAVTELSHDGELTPENLPENAVFYWQRFLSGRKNMHFHPPRKNWTSTSPST